jgi:hypothetical protein
MATSGSDDDSGSALNQYVTAALDITMGWVVVGISVLGMLVSYVLITSRGEGAFPVYFFGLLGLLALIYIVYVTRHRVRIR